MSTGSRIGKILTGTLLIAGAIIMILEPEWGYLMINLLLGITLLVSAIRILIDYFTLARHMVGGSSTLFSGLIRLDLAFFTLTLSDMPKIFLLIYLTSIFGVDGILHLARGLEAKKRHAPDWYRSFLSGVINLAITILCVIFIQNTTVMVIIFSIGMILIGLRRITSAFYRSQTGLL